MRHVVGWIFPAVMLAALASAPPAAARTVTIEMSAALPDYSDRSIDQALKRAVDDCVRRATTMGLSWIWLQDAAIVRDSVVVQMVATDDDAEDEDEVRVLDLTSRTALDRLR
jgi:hypothetical protein